MLLNFGTRKIQRVKYSYSVSLPPEWVKTMNLEKGDSISIDMENNKLVLTPVSADQSTTGASQA